MLRPVASKLVVDPLILLANYKLLKKVGLTLLGPSGRKRMGLLKTLITFGVGFYGGAYAAQNYSLPKMDEPNELYRKAKEYLDQYKK